MRITLRLTVAGALAALAACAPSAPSASPAPTSPPATASASSTAASTPTAAASSSPGSTTASGPRECAASQLAGSWDAASGAAGTMYDGFEVRNTSSTSCLLQGFFGVQLQDTAGHVDTVQYSTESGTVGTPLVTLPPDTAPLNSGNDNGHAILYVAWPDNCDAYVRVQSILFTPPHLSGAFAVTATAPHSSGPSSLCTSGVRMGPISPRGTQQPF